LEFFTLLAVKTIGEIKKLTILVFVLGINFIHMAVSQKEHIFMESQMMKVDMLQIIKYV